MNAHEHRRGSASAGARRPPVSIVVPFAGDTDEAEELLAALAELRLGHAGDELLVVDNQPGGAVRRDGPARVVADATEASSYYARNRGAEEAANDWLLFCDADCRPPVDLLDRLFAQPIPGGCGIVAGGVVSEPGQPQLAARYARTRNMVSEAFHVGGEGIAGGALPAGITANLLVRRSAFEAAGGFHEGVFSGADIEFCWRVQELGFTLEHRPDAAVRHVHPASVRGLLRKARRYGAGRRWVNRRYPGWTPRPPLVRPLARCAVAVVAWTVTLRFERALFKAIDAGWLLAMARGYALGDNRAARPRVGAGAPGAALVAGEFPVAGVAEGGGQDLHVEAAARSSRPDRALARSLHPAYAEDDLPLERAGALAGVAIRRPAALARERRRGVRELARLAPAASRLARLGPERIEAAAGAQDRAAALRRLSGIAPG